MANLLEMLFGGGDQLPPSAAPGTIRQGPNGQNYQYAQTTGMAGAQGDQGWIPTNMKPQSGIGDILSTIGPAIAMIDPRNQALGAALMQANMGRQKERKNAAVQNQTAAWLQKQGVGEGEAAYLTSDPDALRGWYKEWKTGNQPDWKIQRLINKDGQEQDFMVDMKNPTRMQALGGPKAENARDKFGNSIIWGRDKDGKWHAMQPSSGGGLQDAPPPAGIELSPPGVGNVDTGTGTAFRDRNGNIIGGIDKNLAGAEEQKAIGKGQGEAAAAYNSMSSKMPGLEKVVGELDELANQATYTTTGQLYNAARKEFGLSPTDAAVARTNYIAKVSNQILPMLRDTFGAQFTAREGDTLMATMGDPDKTPAEKQAVLKSFIEQKRRDVEALGRQAGYQPGDPAASTPAGQRVIQQMTNPQPMGGGDGWQDLGGGIRMRKVN